MRDGDRVAPATLLHAAIPAAANLRDLIADEHITVLLADAAGHVLTAFGQFVMPPEQTRLQTGLPGKGTYLPSSHYLIQPIGLPACGNLGLVNAARPFEGSDIGALRVMLHTTATLIAHEWVAHTPNGAVAIHLHDRHAVLDTPFEGLMVFDKQGTLLRATPLTWRLLAVDAVTRPPLRHFVALEKHFGVPWRELIRKLVRHPAQRLQLKATRSDHAHIAAVARLL